VGCSQQIALRRAIDVKFEGRIAEIIQKFVTLAENEKVLGCVLIFSV
jgi:hypothetical protein